MAWSMDTCRDRLQRFDEHLDRLNTEHRLYIKEDPYEIVPEFEPNTGWHTLYVIASPVPPIIGILIGEAAHQLRATLDNIAWQLANLDGPAPKPDKVQFPIFSREPKRAFASLSSMAGMRDQHKTALEMLQPYTTRERADLSPFEALAWITNTDKHKLVHAAASMAQDVAPHVLQAYSGYRLAASEFVEGWVVFEGKAKIGRVCIRPTEQELQMHMQGTPDLAIAFGDTESPLYGVAADGYLHVLKETVEKVIALFDRPGQDGSPPWP